MKPLSPIESFILTLAFCWVGYALLGGYTDEIERHDAKVIAAIPQEMK